MSDLAHISETLNERIKNLGKYRGFPRPRTTPTPDDVFDLFLAELSHAELKVLLYIVRRTFGFKKDSDTISLKQITDGIKKRDGSILDRGAGVSERTAIRAIQTLENRGLIKVERNVSDRRGHEINKYSLHFSG